MASFNLGKQIGPLPLGAWIVVVGAGLGIAYFSTRQSSEPVEVVDTSGTPGVGTGEVGGWSPTSPASGSAFTPPTISTNEDWAREAINYLIGSNYPATLSDSAIRKYINGVSRSIQENALVAIALTKLGSPPQPLPPEEGEPTTPSTPTKPPSPVLIRVGEGFVWKGFTTWLANHGYPGISFADIYRLNPLWYPSHVRNGIVIKAGEVRIK